MQQQTFRFTQAESTFYFDADLALLRQVAPPETSFLVADEHIMQYHAARLQSWRVITIPAGESSKDLATVDYILRTLIGWGADRNALLVGIGGGVVTDITGFVAGIYKRGIRCGFVPTTVLAMVDASIGGKNGLDLGVYKNMIGLIRQPEFVLYDYSFLNTLPETEWTNGFAEIIKHALIADADMFQLLEQNTLSGLREKPGMLARLLEQNARLKIAVVQADEFEQADRKLLNFGHTLAHAIENKYDLPHGYAVSVGMVFAMRLSEQYLQFSGTGRAMSVLAQYGLPLEYTFDRADAFTLMSADKKRAGGQLHFVLLEQIGKARTLPIDLDVMQHNFLK